MGQITVEITIHFILFPSFLGYRVKDRISGPLKQITVHILVILFNLRLSTNNTSKRVIYGIKRLVTVSRNNRS